MAAKRDDDLKDSFYLYIMRSSIGAGLRTQYSPNGHMPDRLSKLMRELDSGEDDHARGRPAKAVEEKAVKEERPPGPARKHDRKR
jgi:hypothetical protein